ncbi:MAG: carboxypeptidase regulatory-like domain-containing protein, partial [Gemmatimonadales bacterium]
VPINGGPHLIENPPSGRLRVAVIDNLGNLETNRILQSEYSWPAPQRLDLHEGGPGHHVRLRFGVRKGMPRIAVHAVDESGQAVADVVVEIASAHAGSSIALPVAFSRTDSEGLARSPFLAPGRYAISVYKLPRHAPHGKPEPVVVVLADDDGERDVTLRLPSRGLGSLRGRVVAPDRTARQYGVSVYVDAYASSRPVAAVVTNRKGEFLIPHLAKGSYHAVVWAQDFLAATVDVDIVPAKETYVTISIRRGGAVVSGRLLDSKGAPLSGIRVNINSLLREREVPRGKPRATDETGRFRVSGLSPGGYMLIFWDLGLMRTFSTSERDETEPIELGDMRVPGSLGEYAIEGRVLDDSDRPVAHAYVCVRVLGENDPWIRFTQSDPEGRYRLTGLGRGTYEVWQEPNAIAGSFRSFPPMRLSIGDVDLEFDLVLQRR